MGARLKDHQVHEIPAPHENYGGCLKFWQKTFAENFSGKLLQKTLAENFCGKLWRLTNLGGYTEFRRLVKIQVYDRTMANVEISAPR
jgi:hypothetical protein